MRSRTVRLMAFVLSLVMLLSSVQTFAFAKVSYPFTAAAAENVNMRRNASSSSTILERIDKGDTVNVTGESGSYYKIEYNNRTGYVIKTFIDLESAATPAPTLAETVTGYPYETTTKDSVNLREKRSLNSALLKKIPKGATVTVNSVSTAGTYAEVEYKGVTGYCKKEYLNLKVVVKATATPKATVTPAATAITLSGSGDTLVSEASGYVLLQKGDSGAAVRALQSALIELGYMSGTVDGKFGSATEKCLIAFQEKNGYPATGTADANLQAFLYEGKPLNAKGVKTEIKTLAPTENVTMTLNDTGDAVGTLQTRLKELGYYAGEITCVYDKATQTAIKAFQKANDLTADGKAGITTRTVLYGAAALAAGVTASPTPAPTATPAPTYTVPTQTLRSGDKGDEVKTLQRRLKELGYYRGAVDGNFGSGSVTALKKFQEANGLEADGVAGTGTYKVLFSVTALASGATATPVPTATPTAAPATPAPTALTEANTTLITLGVNGEAVISLQNRLTQLGYYTATADGICKADDVAAIKAFQKNNNLKVDGKAGYDTQSLLYSVGAVTATGALAGGTVDTYTTLRRGSTGSAVSALQTRLIALGYLTGTADGNYGTATATAVLAFQKANGLVRDAIAGSGTQSLLYSSMAGAAATATPAPNATATPSTSLKQGDSSDNVKTMQQQLITLGYLSGKADGIFGLKTFEAIRAFQRAYGLTVDGVAGAKTLAKLTTASAGASATQAPTATAAPSVSTRPTASKVIYANWYTTVKAICRKYPYATIYDYKSGLSWQVHIFSLGAHADAEPLTAADTANMEKAFGGNDWGPFAVWVVFADGSVYMASTHSMPHLPQHRTSNNFNGHICIHFPRTLAQVTAIGPYATRHQEAIDAGWKVTQSMQ